MAQVSISAALRTPKVGAQFAPNALSERRLFCGDAPGGGGNVCPMWNGQDNLGREVSYWSFNNLTEGHDPSQRIAVENFLRPNYNVTLNVEGGLNNQDQQYGSSFGGYDTFGVRRDEAYKFNGEYGLNCQSVPQQVAADGKGLSYEQQAERARFNRAMRRHFETNRYSTMSGMR